MDLLIKNGTLVFAEESYRADLEVKNGKIVSIGENIVPEPGTNTVDAAGKLVLPGAIDPHQHLYHIDDHFAGTRASACGGTTTVIDFAIQDANETFLDCIKRRKAAAEKLACIDYAFHVGVRDSYGATLEGMAECVEFGVSSFKVYMVYDDYFVDDGVFFSLLEKSRKVGAIVQVHAENKAMLAFNTERLLAEGKTGPYYHYVSRPEYVESEAVIRAINIAKSAGAPLYIVHLGCREGMDAVTKARDEGYPIIAETCPHYLNFTSEVYEKPNAHIYVCSPTIKGKDSQDALWVGIKRGDISTIGSDHCPFNESGKKDMADFTQILNGCSGAETMYPYMLSQANAGRISFNKAVALCATNVASIFGCSKKKGSLAVGKDADIVIYDTEAEFVVRNAEMHSDCDHTMWEGERFKGCPIATYSRGRLVCDHGKFVGEKGSGEFVKCEKLDFD